jgi:DNA repair protein RadA/Sms
MARTRTLFFCTDCGNESARWAGQCAVCGAWNTIAEQPAESRRASDAAVRTEAVRLGDVASRAPHRIGTGIEELDFVLGGGIVPGSLVLVGGEPGIGKSTLLLQAASKLEASGVAALYVSGEESATQIAMRANRIGEGWGDVHFLAATDLDEILDTASRLDPRVIIIDSIQTVRVPDLDGGAGSVSHVRESASRLQRMAKPGGTAVLIVGHVTKDGSVAGPRTLEHIVDTVLYFENSAGADHRVLRATKNRFGSADEIGVFRMTASGLVGAEDASAFFLSGRRAEVSGTAVAVAIEGTRPLLVEVQALCTRASYGAPQRVANGFDRQRLSLLLAVLEKHAGLAFGTLDVFINVAGGARLTEPAADLAVVAALASSAADRPVPEHAVFAGEIGLGGEVRPVGQIEKRLVEAGRLGFRLAFVPPSSSRHDSLRLHCTSQVDTFVQELLR